MIVVQVNSNGKGTYGLLQQSQNAAYRSTQAAIPAISPADVKCRALNRTALEIECFENLRHVLAPSVPLKGQMHSVKVPSYLGEWWVQLYRLAPQSDLVR
jgi:hypothetical protein